MSREIIEAVRVMTGEPVPHPEKLGTWFRRYVGGFRRWW